MATARAGAQLPVVSDPAAPRPGEPRAAARARRPEHLVLLGLVVVAALLRFSTLDLQSFWFDEAVTVADDLRPSLWETLRSVARWDATPPLYFVLAWGWVQLFGEGEVGLRSLSALFGTATVPVAYAVGARLTTPRAGLILAGLFAVSPLMLWFGQDARAYAVLIFFGTLSVLLFVRALDDRTPRAIALWALAAALVVFSHYFGGFLVAVQGVWLLAAGPRRPVLAAGAALTLVVASLIPILRSQVDNGGTDWVDDVSLFERLKDVPDRFVVGPRDVLGDQALGAVMGVLILTALVIAWLIVGSLRRAPGRAPLDRRELRGAVLMAVLGGGAIAVPLLLAMVGIDVMLYRYVTVAWVPLVGLVAVVLGSRRMGRLGIGAAVVAGAALLAMSIATLVDPRLHREDWRSASAIIGKPADDRIVAVADWIEKEPLLAYGHRFTYVPRSGVRVKEIAVVGQLHLWNSGGALSGRPAGREPARFDPPPEGFVVVERRRLELMTVIRMRAKVPRVVTAAELWARCRIPPEALVLEPARR